MKFIPILAMALSIATAPYAAIAEQESSGDLRAQMEKLQSLPPAEREAMMQDMMKNAQQMQSCIEKAGGQEALEELQSLHDAHQQQISAMCDKGRRDKAQAYAQDASQELLKDTRVSQLRECSRTALQNMPQLSKLADTGGIDPNKHVCD